MVRKFTWSKGEKRGVGEKGGDVMGSTLAALAMSAMAMGPGAPGSTAQASIAPEEMSGMVKPYRIRSGSMAAALNDLADANGLHVLFDADLALGLRTKGLKGRHSLRAALDRLLAGTNLTYRLSDNRRTVLITLAQAATTARSDASPVALPTIDVNATQQGYAVPYSSSGTKTNTPIFQTPVSIQVVPAEVIEDQKAFRVQDALENVSGVQPRGSLGGFRERYIIRGFSNGSNFYRNGLRVSSSGFTSNFETADIDRIEVIKGGGSVLYGRGEPSGSVIFWTKMARNIPSYSVEQNFGSFGYYRTNWDLGAPVASDGSLAYRFSGAYTNSQSFRDFGQSQGFLLYPTLMWRPTADTTINAGVEVAYQTFYADFGIPAVGKLPAPIPISRSLQDPNDPLDHQHVINLDFSLTHRFNETWSLTNRFLASYRHEDDLNIGPAALLNNQTLTRLIGYQSFNQTSYATNLDLVGNFNTWDIKHKVLIGFDYFNDYVDYITGRHGGPTTPSGFPIDIFNPIYGVDRSLFTPSYPARFLDQNGEAWSGIYFQDQMTLWDRLHIMGGGRQDWIASNGTNNDYFGASSSKSSESAFSPRVGALYELLPWLAVYGNWSQTFGANNGLDANGKVLAPETGQQYEVGLKGQSLDGRVQSTLAFYNITKQNVLTRDLRFPDANIFALIGEVRSRGIELDIDGRIMEGLDAVVAFAYTDARILVDGSGNEGHRVQGVPATSGRLWLKYEFPKDSFLNGFAIGGGPYLVSNRAGDNANTFTLPGFARLDLMASYRTNIWNYPVTAQLNVKNAFNQRYFDSADTSNASPRVSITPGQPLTIIGSLRVQF
jgi:iron complex outermembrane receptor protein